MSTPRTVLTAAFLLATVVAPATHAGSGVLMEPGDLVPAERAAMLDLVAQARIGDPGAFDDWAQSWSRQLAAEARDPDDRRAEMRAANPAFIPRNHRVQQVIEAAERGDLAPFDDLLRVVTQPFSDHRGLEHLMLAPEPDEIVRQTFCGT